MADRDKVDELVIELTARDKATQKIDNLAKSLRGLGDSLTIGLSSAKMNSVASSLKSISNATQELGRSTRAINNLPKLTTELSNMMNTLHDAPSISKDVLSLAHALSKIDGSAIKGFSKIATPKINTESVTEEMKAVESEERKVDSQTKEITESMRTFGTVTRDAFKSISADKIGKLNFKPIANDLGRMASKVKGLAKNFVKLVRNASLFHKINNMGLKKGFTTLLRYTVGIRSLFVLANRVRSAIEDGNKNLAKYSAEFNTSMSRYKSGLGTLKNAMSVAFAPLVNYFSDAVNRILDSFINAFNTIARLMATLTGAKQVVQATRYYNDFADSLGSASKNAKNLTTGIDELNILNDQTGSGSGGASTDVQDMFETVDVTSEFDGLINKLKDMWDKADFTDLGTALADKINGALQNIDWATIKKNAGKLGKSVATFLNGVFEEELNGQTFGYTIGKTIGEGINTGIEFAYAFVTNFHWDSFGQFVADGLKGALETVQWKKLGKTLSGIVNGVLTSLTTFFSDKKLWQDLGKSIGDFFSGIEWKKTWFNLTKLAKAVAEAIETSLVEWAKTDPESFGIASAIGVAIGGLKVADLVAKINGTTLSAVIGKSIVKSIKDAGGINLLDVGFSAMITDSIGKLLSGKDLAGNVWAKEGESLEDYAKRNYESQHGVGTYDDMLKQQEEFNEKYQQGLQTIKKAFTENDFFAELKKSYSDNFASIPDNLSTAFDNIKNNFSLMKEDLISDLSTLKENISSSLSETKENTITKWEETKTDLATKWEEIKTNASTSFQNVKDTISTKWEETKTKTSNKWTEIKNNLSTTWTNLKKESSDRFTEMKENIGKSFDTLKENIKRPINAIISFVEKMANGVVDSVNKIIATVNSLGSVDIPGVGTVGVDIPTLNHVHIPRLADGGFVPNTNMGSLFWAGENGAEIVAHASGGTEVLNASQVASAVASGVREAIIDAVTPYMVDLVNSNQAIADKDMSVNIGDREIAEANRRGESSLGLQLVTV